MKIVIAPDSYKGSLSAFEVANAIKSGIFKVDTEIESVLVPMADGGEGTVEALVAATGGQFVEYSVHDPLFRKINSFYGIMGDGKTAVIEMAAASGLPLLKPEERNPLNTTSYGTGELIINALDRGCEEIIIGLGGSATNDGGIGMAQALGIRFLDENGLDVGFGGGELSKIKTVDRSNIDQRIDKVKFIAACDVDNPLCGEKGASKTYAPQKGASEADINILDVGLSHLAKIVKDNLSIDKIDFLGAGAAGGLGFGVMVFLGGCLERGIDIIGKVTRLGEKMEGADLVITGEGKIDYQTAYGKTPFGVAKLAKEKNLPVIAIAGSLGKDYSVLYQKGFDGIFSIIDKTMNLEDAICDARELLENTAESLVRCIMALKNTNKN